MAKVANIQGPAGPTGAQGPTGPQGPAGATGGVGPPGPGVPAGGTTGQVLQKSSATDYATAWAAMTCPLWTDTGTTLTPTVATRQVTVPGPTASGAGVDQSALVLGSRTVKARLHALPALDWAGFSVNRRYDGSAWNQDDATKPSWDTVVTIPTPTTDAWQIERQPAGGAGAVLLKVDSAGRVTVVGTQTGGTDILQGAGSGGTAKAHLGWNADRLNLSTNRDMGRGAADDTSKISWTLDMGGAASDNLGVYRSPAGASFAFTNLFNIDNAGNLSFPGVLPAGKIIRSASAVAPAASWATGAINNWWTACTATVTVPYNNEPVFYFSSLCANAFTGNGSFYYCVMRDGGILWQSICSGYSGGGVGFFGFAGYDNGAAAGSHNYSFALYPTNGAIAFAANSMGLFSVWCLA